MVIVARSQYSDPSSNPGRGCFSHCANILMKGTNPILLSQAMRKYKGRLSSLTFPWQMVKGKENSEVKHVKLRLKIDLVSHSPRAENLNIDIYI